MLKRFLPDSYVRGKQAGLHTHMPWKASKRVKRHHLARQRFPKTLCRLEANDALLPFPLTLFPARLGCLGLPTNERAASHRHDCGHIHSNPTDSRSIWQEHSEKISRVGTICSFWFVGFRLIYYRFQIPSSASLPNLESGGASTSFSARKSN